MNDYELDRNLLIGTLLMCFVISIFGAISQSEKIDKLEKKNDKLKTELKVVTKERDLLDQKVRDYGWQLEQKSYIDECRCGNG